MEKAQYEIGTQFKSQGKHPYISTVTDIYYTYNSKNELVELAYVTEHEFCGQIVTGRVCETTIKLAEIQGRLIK